MRDIFEEAELSAGAVYHYFDSKHDIIAASFDFDFARSITRFEAASESDDPLAALADLLSFLFGGLKEASALGAPRVNVQGWGEALVNPSLHVELDKLLGLYREATSRIIRRAQAQGQVAPGLDPLAVSNTLISLYYGLELQLALDPEMSVDPYAEVVAALLRGGGIMGDGGRPRE